MSRLIIHALGDRAYLDGRFEVVSPRSVHAVVRIHDLTGVRDLVALDAGIESATATARAIAFRTGEKLVGAAAVTISVRV